MSWLVMGGAIASRDCASAQITPDGTLGAESSVVTPTNANGLPPSNQIDGGAARGANLFHSFDVFSIPTGSEAFFNNATDIQNIISRVTGASISNIDGLIRANGTANLFLINPHGITFGSNASLSIGGSFVGSTASSVNFTDGSVFSATAPQTTPLLTVSVPLGLQFGETRESIAQFRATNSSGIGVLQVPQGKTLALVGGNVSLDGGTLRAPGGRVELAGVAEPATVGLNIDSNNLSLSFSEGVRLSDVSFNRAVVSVSAINSGRIAVTAQNINIWGSALRANRQSGSGSVNTQAGDITLNATEAIAIADDSDITSEVRPEAVGNGGNINIIAGTLSITNGAQLSTGTYGGQENTAGNVIITARDTVSLVGVGIEPSGLFSRVEIGAVGNGGNINVTTGSLFVTDGARISANTFGQGNAGSVTIDARDTVFLDGVGSRVSLDGVVRSGNSGGVFTRVENMGVGNGGDINVTTRALSATNGARLSAGSAGVGNAGSVTINARDTVFLDGVGSNGNFSGLVAALPLPPLNPSINESSPGQGGNLTIKTGQLIVQNGAEVNVLSERLGSAGEIRVEADSIELNDRGKLQAEAVLSQGGNINLQVRDVILMRRQGLISATAGGTGNGGNVTIGNATNAPLIVAFPAEDSDIIAQASEGQGGNINIFTQGIFGLEARNPRTPQTSDINASSEVGIDGTVEINTPDVDPSQGLVNLPTVPVDTEVVQACQPGGSEAQSEFVITGLGGLPSSPNEALTSDAIQVDWVTLNPEVEDRSSQISTNLTAPEPALIVEAQGWVMDKNGEVVLTASAPTATPHIWQTPADCHGS